MRIAILDDYQSVALDMADWSVLASRAEITVFADHIAEPDALVARLEPFEIVCVMRERTPLPRAILQRLPRLRLIASTAFRNASIDVDAARELGIAVVHTGYESTPTIEHTWALILGASRNLVEEARAVREGAWQVSLGVGLRGKTLGVLGLGNVGREVAILGKAFGMKTIAWSPNMTADRAAAAGAEMVGREALFERSDVLTIHMVLSTRTLGLVDAALLDRMKPTARLINTSRGPIVDENALIEVLRDRRIAGAATDVFATEPLPADHPFRRLGNVLVTPHIGYVTEDLYRIFYGDTVKNISAWLDVALNPSPRAPSPRARRD